MATHLGWRTPQGGCLGGRYLCGKRSNGKKGGGAKIGDPWVKDTCAKCLLVAVRNGYQHGLGKQDWTLPTYEEPSAVEGGERQ